MKKIFGLIVFAVFASVASYAGESSSLATSMVEACTIETNIDFDSSLGPECLCPKREDGRFDCRSCPSFCTANDGLNECVKQGALGC